MLSEDCIWTDKDTTICKQGKSSGLAISLKTGKSLTLQELQSLATEFDKVRNFTDTDKFLEDKIKSVPIDF